MPIFCPKCGSGRVHRVGKIRRQSKLEVGYQCSHCGKVFQIDQDYKKGKMPLK